MVSKLFILLIINIKNVKRKSIDKKTLNLYEGIVQKIYMNLKTPFSKKQSYKQVSFNKKTKRDSLIIELNLEVNLEPKLELADRIKDHNFLLCFCRECKNN